MDSEIEEVCNDYFNVLTYGDEKVRMYLDGDRKIVMGFHLFFYFEHRSLWRKMVREDLTGSYNISYDIDRLLQNRLGIDPEHHRLPLVTYRMNEDYKLFLVDRDGNPELFDPADDDYD